MSILSTLVILAVLIFLLVKSADILEQAFIEISEKLKIKPFITGFVILAMSSSLPEAFVAINAVSTGKPELSVGNLIGATIIMLTFIIGVSAIKAKKISFKGIYSTKEVLISLGIIYTQIIVLIDKRVDWIEGVMLIILYLAFLIYIVGKSKALEISFAKRKQSFTKVFITGVVGVAGLLIFSSLTVNQALHLATQLAVPPILLGLLVLSIGTNLPELVILFRSNNQEKEKLAAGNFIGSATLNSVILGMLIVLHPTKIENFEALIPALIILSITIFIFSLMVINDREITKKEGYFLVFIYILYVASELFINRMV